MRIIMSTCKTKGCKTEFGKLEFDHIEICPKCQAEKNIRPEKDKFLKIGKGTWVAASGRTVDQATEDYIEKFGENFGAEIVGGYIPDIDTMAKISENISRNSLR